MTSSCVLFTRSAWVRRWKATRLAMNGPAMSSVFPAVTTSKASRWSRVCSPTSVFAFWCRPATRATARVVRVSVSASRFVVASSTPTLVFWLWLLLSEVSYSYCIYLIFSIRTESSTCLSKGFRLCCIYFVYTLHETSVYYDFHSLFRILENLNCIQLSNTSFIIL